MDLTAAQLASVLLILNQGPPWQEVCIASNESRSCAEFQSYDDPVWSNPFEGVYYLSSPEQLWAIECGDTVIKYDGGVCKIGNLYLSIAFEGYGFRIQEDLRDY